MLWLWMGLGGILVGFIAGTIFVGVCKDKVLKKRVTYADDFRGER